MKRFLTFFTLMSLCFVSLFAQEKTISGVVVDATGEPVIGASVLVAGTNIGTITDYDGLFTISVPVSAKTLIISFVGMETQEVPVKDNLKVVLQESSVMVDEVIAVAYGNTPKGSFAGSAQAVKAENIEKKNPSEISKALAGEVAGVQVLNTSGQPGTGATIRIRGIGSVNASSAPLYVVDGVPYQGDISSIDPGDIASTTILKDATATSLYGSRGANGVILITTKKGTSGEEGKIDVDVKYGANMRLLPLYETISSPEEYLLMAWQGIYTPEYVTTKNMNDSKIYADAQLFGDKGLPDTYNLWNRSGSGLIRYVPGMAAPTMAPGVKRKAGYDDLESWEDAIFRVGQKAEASVKFRGGTDKLTYFTSFGYLKDEGYYRASDFNRFNVRANLDYQPKKWLKGTLNMQYAYTSVSNPKQGDDMDNGFNYINLIPSIYPVYERDENGNIPIDPATGLKKFDYGMQAGTSRPFGAGINPAGSLYLDQENAKAHNMMMNGSLEFKLYDGLKFTLNVSGQYLGVRAQELTNKFYGNAAGTGYIIVQQTNYFSLVANQLLEYNKTFAEHTIRAMVGHETAIDNSNYVLGYKKGLVEPNVPELDNAVSLDNTGSGSATSTLESYLATVSYSYDDRYMITGNYRADGSSKFAKGHRWGHFGSVGVAWNLTNESFMQDVDWLKNTKLRVSWGVLGNQDTGSYLFSDHWSIENVLDESGYPKTFRGTKNLTWERSHIVDLGLEFDISKYLTAEIDYYYKLTDQMLFTRNVAPSNGFGGFYTNDGKMMNQGVELQFNVHAVDTRNVKLDIRLNGAHMQNKMIQMPVDRIDDKGNEIRMIMSGGMAEGHSLYDWYLPEYAGVNPENGKAQYWIYYDADKFDYVTENGGKFDVYRETKDASQIRPGETGPNYISSLYEYQKRYPNANIQRIKADDTYGNYATSTYVGKSALPKFEGGIGFDLEVYGVTISAMCSYRFGGYGYDNVYAQLMHSDEAGKCNWHVDMRNAWSPWNTTTLNDAVEKQIPRLSNGADTYANMASTRFLTSNSYFSLNNVSVGYKFPKKLIQKIKLESLQLWVAGDNLAIATARKGYNPMVSIDGSSDAYQYTPLSTIMGGIKLTF